ncbi:hypothetical protein JCM11491_000604 [Sporobolomyces phaffii]
MTSATKPHFVLDGNDDDDSEDDGRTDSRSTRRRTTLPSIVVQRDNGRPPRDDNSDDDERHVGFAPTERDARSTKATTTDRRARSSNDDDDTYPPPPPRPRPTTPPRSRNKWTRSMIPESLAWVPSKLNWKGLRPVVRATIASWAGVVLTLAHPSQVALGRAGFLVMVVSVISPAALPIANQLEQSFFQFLLVSVSWAWACVALAVAHAARTRYRWTAAEFAEVSAQPYRGQGLSAAQVANLVADDLYHGKYLEPASSAVCAVFLGASCGFFLWLRGYLGPSPALFGVIFAIILQVIALTVGVLFPYAYYGIGLTFFVPFACQHAITIVCTLVVFPETLAHQFSDRAIATLAPLRTVIQRQQLLLAANPRTHEWLECGEPVKLSTNEALASLAQMNLAEANLTREVSFARVGGKDLTHVLHKMRVLTARTTGFVRFYDVVSNHLHRDAASDAKGGPVADQLTIHLGRSGAPSTVASPDDTPASTRPPSPDRRAKKPNGDDAVDDHDHPTALAAALDQVERRHHERDSSFRAAAAARTTAPSYRRSQSTPIGRGVAPNGSSNTSRSRSRHRHHPHHHDRDHRDHHRASHVSLSSLLHDVLHPHVDIKPVGVVASMRYADLEDILSNPRDEAHIEEIVRLLGQTSRDLLAANDCAVGHLVETVHRIKSTENTWSYVFHASDDVVDRQVAASERQLAALRLALDAYRTEQRLDVVRPFAKLFDPYGGGGGSAAAPAGELDGSGSSSFETPSHRGLFWAFSYQASLLGWTEALVDVYEAVLRIEKKRRRPRIWFPDWSKARFDKTSAQEGVDDEDPDALGDLDIHSFSARRHPDYRPPKTAVQFLGVKLARFAERMTRRDVLFGVKAAVLMGLCTMPAYFPSTSYFFQRERGVWVIVMVALTTTQFVGDTIFGFVLRVFGTFGGAVYGLAVWSIAAQNGRGNPYAVATVLAFGLFPIFFWRVHVMPPMKAILPAVTSMLIIGYSWQNAHDPSPTSIGYGWEVAWKRFVNVIIGISIAFVWTYVPPVTTQKISIRRTYSRAIDQLGSCFAQIVSFANVKQHGGGRGPTHRPPKAIVKNIGTLRARIAKTAQPIAMTKYELSLQGKWPEEHYMALQTLQMEILDLYGELCAVFAALDDKWTAALLHRSQLSNPYFLQDLFTTYQLLSSALYHGSALPMVYNPLLERFLHPPEVHEAGRPYAYDVTLGDDHLDDVAGLPQHVTLDVLCSLEYMKFSTGVSSVYAIVNRLDRLMFVTKSLVGEQYLLYGLDLSNAHHHHGGGGGGGGGRRRGGDSSRHFSFPASPSSRRTSVDASNNSPV